ncbi:acyltransferase-like protein At3g26840, chloroplastic [Punica granatum]|uniref:Acyltransferase-like protein At3g26840, chloroplastic n=1 Tax=Punica granatum TaxID=22663 RepID=A0A6P8CHZ2_PUNGR|nr:acyltransferase-like protein At3g26840, chloroplastic [Punica granatum]
MEDEGSNAEARKSLEQFLDLIKDLIRPAVAACNPELDLMLLLANPGAVVFWRHCPSHKFKRMKTTSGCFISLVPLPELMPEQIQLSHPYLLCLMRGDPLKTLTGHFRESTPVTRNVKGINCCQVKLRLQDFIVLYKDARFADTRRKDDGFDFVTTIKCALFYRSRKSLDYISDYLPPTYSEFINRFCCDSLGGPVLLVGYHMLLGLQLVLLVIGILIKRNIHVRGIAHLLLFAEYKEGCIGLNPSFYDKFCIMGAVPVSGMNHFKLLSRKSHILLYPDGNREALHKGVTVGYEDLMKIPNLRNLIREMNNEIVRLCSAYYHDDRTTVTGEVTNRDMHLPGIMPKIPERFYFMFGKPIETKGREQELRDRDKSHEVKSEKAQLDSLNQRSEIPSHLASLMNNARFDRPT